MSRPLGFVNGQFVQYPCSVAIFPCVIDLVCDRQSRHQGAEVAIFPPERALQISFPTKDGICKWDMHINYQADLLSYFLPSTAQTSWMEVTKSQANVEEKLMSFNQG